MDHESLDLFVGRLDGFADWPSTKQIDFLFYHLTKQSGSATVSANDIERCFGLLDLRPYGRVAAYLSENIGRDGKYVKQARGYRLERGKYEAIRAFVDSEPKRVLVDQYLGSLVPKIKDPYERSFLEEAMQCYRVEAYRATIVMTWALAIAHLQKHVFEQRLSDFNYALAQHSDKKMRQIMVYDDFSDLKEARFIEIMRSATIISNDVRKLLDEKLGIRNSAGHPSSITFSGHKTTEFALDLVENILLKY